MYYRFDACGEVFTAVGTQFMEKSEWWWPIPFGLSWMCGGVLVIAFATHAEGEEITAIWTLMSILMFVAQGLLGQHKELGMFWLAIISAALPAAIVFWTWVIPHAGYPFFAGFLFVLGGLLQFYALQLFLLRNKEEEVPTA